MNTLQVNGQYEEGYKRALEEGRLEPDLLRSRSSAIRNVEEKLGDIKTSNLIFVFSKFNSWFASANCAKATVATTRKYQLRIPYVLFNRESDSYRFVDQNHVDAFSTDAVELLHDIVRTHIKCIPSHDRETGHNIVVYEVRRPTPVWPDC